MKNKKKQILIIAMAIFSGFFLLQTIAAEEEPEIEWEKTFGGIYRDEAYSIQLTDDGYIITGYTNSLNGDDDVWLFKTDVDGNELWSKTFGGNEDDSGFYVQPTDDNGYIILGATKSYGLGDWDYWLIKTDNEGNELWNKTFGSAGWDVGYAVQQTNDGGYILTGYIDVTEEEFRDNIWVIKTDVEGNELWNKSFGNIGYNQGSMVLQTSDRDYIVVGKKDISSMMYDIWLIKMDVNGNELWNKTFGNTVWFEQLGASFPVSDEGKDIKLTSDGGYIIAGLTASGTAGGYNIWLIKIDADDNELWNRTYEGIVTDEGSIIQQTTDGGYIIVGQTSPSGPTKSDILLIKTDSQGNLEWNTTFGGNEIDIGYSVIQTSDEKYLIVGKTFSYGEGSADVWLIKVSGYEIDGDNGYEVDGGTPGFEFLFVVSSVAAVLVWKRKRIR